MKAFRRWFSSTFMTDIYTCFDLVALLWVLHVIRNTTGLTNFFWFATLWLLWCLVGANLIRYLKNKSDMCNKVN